MKFERIDEHSVMVNLSLSELKNKGFDIHNLTDHTRDHILEMIMSALEDSEHFEQSDALTVTVHCGHHGMKVVITDIPFDPSNPEKMPLMNPSQLLPNLFNHAMKHPPFFDDMDDFLDDVTEQDYVVEFRTLEDVIQLVSDVRPSYVKNLFSNLYSYNNKFYLYIDFIEEQEEDKIQNILSFFQEYGQLSRTTIHVLDEYGKRLMLQQAIEEIYRHFVNKEGMKFPPDYDVFSIRVPLEHDGFLGFIEVLVDDTHVPYNNKVYFRNASTDCPIEFNVSVDMVKRTVLGEGSKKYRTFIEESVIPFYLDEKHLL